MSWQREVIAKLIEFEGSINHMYLDSKGLVTVGVGSLLRTAKDAEPLAFVVRDTGKRATPDQIRAEWETLSAQEQDNFAAGHFRAYTKLDLPNKAIEDQLLEHLDIFQEGLSRNIDAFDSYPVEARKAILDMAFNLGVAGVVNKFPSFIQAFRDRDWPRCHAECNRRGIADARNDYVKGLFRQLGS